MTADDLLTRLAATPRDQRQDFLTAYPLTLLRKAADLCGTDAVELTKAQAINAILSNF